MTENNTEPTTEPDIEIELAAPEQVAYDELLEEFGEELIQGDIEEVVKNRVRALYDNQEQVKQRVMQAQQQAQQAVGPQ